MTLPQSFIDRTKLILKDEYPEFENALNSVAPTSIRYNDKFKYIVDNELVKWCSNAFYLNERPLFTADPLFHAGAYYVQEASSMFLYNAVNQHFKNAEKVLDLCAAPGGKSTLLAQTLLENCILVSNEIVRSRAYILAENLSKWGNPNTIVSNNQASDFSDLKYFFDAVVIDAPCSGEGMFRKDAGSISEWSLDNVYRCAERQKEIVNDVWNALKPGGILIYSTCTYNREENEENVAWICQELGAEFLKIDLEGNNEIVESDLGYRFYPHRTKGEGFFISVLRKNTEEYSKKIKKTELKKSIKFFDSKEFPYKLKTDRNWTYLNDNNFIRAYDADNFNDFMLLIQHFNCIESGILQGEIKGKDFIPATQLALSKAFDIESAQSVELDYKTAISFLKKETISLPNEPLGFLLVKYKNLPLGWVKNIGNRCNNLYPQNWRIRMNL